jgi:hypothetical protein
MTRAPRAPYGGNPPPAVPRARPGGGGWTPPAGGTAPVPQPRRGGPVGPRAPLAAPGRSPHATAQRGSAPLSGVIEGQVRGIDRRTDPRGRKRQDAVWTFRIERYDDLGNQVAVVPVEMRGRAFTGALGEGDWVRVRGVGRGGNLRTRRAENVTTGSLVKAKRHWTWLKRVLVLAVLAAVGLAVAAAVADATADAALGPGEDPVVEALPATTP